MNGYSFISVRSNNPLVKNLKITTSEEDFEFKKLLINTVVLLGRNPVIDDVRIEILFVEEIISLLSIS